MAQNTLHFKTRNGFEALLDHIYNIKFSKHVPLVMVVLFAVFAVWRTNNYLQARMHSEIYISIALAVCIELAMLASGAACFVSMRAAYIRELKQEDADRAKLGVYVAFAMLGVTTLALMVLAGADGALESNGDPFFVVLMLLVQFIQSGAIVFFINVADLEEREKLRKEFADYERDTKRQLSIECPYCHIQVTPNNRKRHIDSCTLRRM